MDESRIPQAVVEWKKILGESQVFTESAAVARYQENVSALSRKISAVLCPASTAEVQQVVRVANLHRTPLYPISGGKNWGLGSALPVRDGAVLVDLRRMNRIHEINAEHHFAVVEPGVTQGQFYDVLRERRLPLMLNVTGAGRGTSLIGNALERGIGYFSSRANELSGLEVVLGNGTVIRTGCGHYDNAKMTHLYRYGVGPFLDGVFAQSNYGIVTRAGLDLIPIHGEHMAVIAKIDTADKLEALVDALVGLRKREVIRTVVHIGNRARAEITLGPLVYEVLARQENRPPGDLRALTQSYIDGEGFGSWSAVWGTQGTPAELKLQKREIKAALRGLAATDFPTGQRISKAKKLLDGLSFIPACRRKRVLLGAIEPIFGLSRGIPTDEPLKSIYWPLEQPIPEGALDPDGSQAGMLYCLPFIPMSGREADDTVNQAELICRKFGFTPYMTLNIVDSRALECVINIAFDRRNTKQVNAAHQCIQDLQEEYIRKGYMLYRVGIQSMSQVVNDQDPFWQTVRDLKKVLDPNHIIAPGRYNLV